MRKIGFLTKLVAPICALVFACQGVEVLPSNSLESPPPPAAELTLAQGVLSESSEGLFSLTAVLDFNGLPVGMMTVDFRGNPLEKNKAFALDSASVLSAMYTNLHGEARNRSVVQKATFDFQENGSLATVEFTTLETPMKFSGKLNLDLKQKVTSANARFASDCEPCIQTTGAPVPDALALDLATTFAPKFYFDKGMTNYPNTIEEIFRHSELWYKIDDYNQVQAYENPGFIQCRGGGIGSPTFLRWKGTGRDPDRIFPFYYDVQQNPNDPNKYFIEYWLFWIRQENCFSDIGGHDYDLEHVVLQVSNWNRAGFSIQLYQHGGYILDNLMPRCRYNYSNGTINNTAPPPAGTSANVYLPQQSVYVGKESHGFYDNSGGNGNCGYFEDFRNPNAASTILPGTANNPLVRMRCTQAEFAYSGKWGNAGYNPFFRDRKYWDMKMCDDNGCEHSDWTSQQAPGQIGKIGYPDCWLPLNTGRCF